MKLIALLLVIPALLNAGKAKMVGNWTHDIENTIKLWPEELSEVQKAEVKKGYSGGIYLNISDTKCSGHLGTEEFELPYVVLGRVDK